MVGVRLGAGNASCVHCPAQNVFDFLLVVLK